MQRVKETLAFMHGSTETGLKESVVGDVDVLQFAISIAGKRRIEFKPGGINRMMVHGAIEVRSSRALPLP